MTLAILSLLFVIQVDQKPNTSPPVWPQELQGAWSIESYWVGSNGKRLPQPLRYGHNLIIITEDRLYILQERLRMIGRYNLIAVKERADDYACLVELSSHSYISKISKDEFVVFGHGPNSQAGFKLKKHDIRSAHMAFREMLEKYDDIMFVGKGSEADTRALVGLAKSNQ